MTVVDNIIANLRAFFGMPEATEAELDQHLEDQLAQPAAAEATEEEPETTVEEDSQEAAAAEQEEQEEQEEASAEARILAELEAIRQENIALREQVAALNQKHLAAAAAYEEQQVEADPRERYLCATTLRAMGRR